MDWWSNSWALVYMLTIGFFFITRELIKSYRIIDRLKDKYKNDLKEEKDLHFWEVDKLQNEIKDYKRRLGIK